MLVAPVSGSVESISLFWKSIAQFSFLYNIWVYFVFFKNLSNNRNIFLCVINSITKYDLKIPQYFKAKFYLS